MLNKTFVITEFGEPFSWTQKYIDHVAHLDFDGWNWKIFTPNKYEHNSPNVEVVPMTAEEFVGLVEKKLGVRPNMFITPKGVPSVHVTDFYVFTGLIFEDYLDASRVDYWGITNMDIVYGNLSKFLPDSELIKCDVWTDDVGPEGGRVNGIFSLWRNSKWVNNLCMEIPGWEQKLTMPPCPKCMGTGDQHTLAGTDEIDMVPIMQDLAKQGAIEYGYPPHYPFHSYDRLPQHMPIPNLKLFSDGSLYEIVKDQIYPDGLGMFDGGTGKEIMYFHFIRTKTWPLTT